MVTQDNLKNPQAKRNIAKPKKEVGKWCEFHKSTTHSTSECQVKQPLLSKINASKSDAYSDIESEPEKGDDRGNKIIDVEPNTTVATMKI